MSSPKTAKLPSPGIKIRVGSLHWRVEPAMKPLVEALRSLTFEGKSSIPGLTILKDKRPVFWGRWQWQGSDYFIKGHENGGLKSRLKSMLGPSPFDEEWRKTWWLRNRGIAAVEPIAVGERRRLGACIESFFVTRWIPGSKNVLEYLESKSRELPPASFRQLRRKTAFELGRLFGVLHAAGAYHRQFHDRNILVRDLDGRMELIPIDLDHLTVAGTVTSQDRDWNFYQLAWHFRRLVETFHPRKRELLMLLQGYDESTRGSGPAAWRELFRHVSPRLPLEPLKARPRRKKGQGFPGSTSETA